MSLEFLEKIRKIGSRYSVEGYHIDGRVLYKILEPLTDRQTDELKKRLSIHLKKAGYEKPIDRTPLFCIPSTKKCFSVIIGSEHISIYPPEEKYYLSESDLPEFKNFLKEIEKVLQEFP